LAIQTITLDGEVWFEIPNFDKMRPFFMNMVSDSNHWLFISSNGGLTAGRKNKKYALFPYYTDDKLTDLADSTGSKTIFQVHKNSSIVLWEPFSNRFNNQFTISRNLYKSFHGNKILFEEINHNLGLTFRYQWNSSHQFGFVRKSELVNHSSAACTVNLLDGIQNVMPYGIDPDLQTATSNLADAYKRTELIKESGIGIFALSALIVDKAEPSEALKANVVWSMGLEQPGYLLSSLQLSNFRDRQPIQQEYDIKGEKGAYFLSAEFELENESTKKWSIIANVNQTHAQVIELNELIKHSATLEQDVNDDIGRGTKNLIQLVAGADGLRYSADSLKDARHYSNVLFNIMRGGTFDDNYNIEKEDLLSYLKKANNVVYEKNRHHLDNLEPLFHKQQLALISEVSKDEDLFRLLTEYLPLKFSRRHGDPSRPWNQFSINTHSEKDNSKILDYEGNWRDIFQNWEALVQSYPDFIEGMIFKFLNASTFDGYNPYRVTKGGFDWEVIEPDNPWSYIGYWGDHQVIYLLKFLEFYHRQKPTSMQALFSNNSFVYANIPYRIKPYAEIIKDPKNTIIFDEKLDLSVRKKMNRMGADGALITLGNGDLHRVNFLEKILALILAKVSNFIPGAGIWMNTQRPEWNDANNALVGNGVSMVTLYYLRRFVSFFESILENSDVHSVNISKELYQCYKGISETLHQSTNVLQDRINDEQRMKITDALGTAGSDYRSMVYSNGFSGEKELISIDDVRTFLHTTQEYLDHSIRGNKRDDNLYHAYNIMHRQDNGIKIGRLSEMLEGQVSVLSSGYLNPTEASELLNALRNSSLYREDQNSYILYPNVQLPGFLQKNNVPGDLIQRSTLLSTLIKEGDTSIIIQDLKGDYHFNGNFRNAGDLKHELAELSNTKYAELVQKDQDYVLDGFESVFNHKAFTGRSGTFYAYEGLGSIYWHMVSKLHLAVEEICQKAMNAETPKHVIDNLFSHYDTIGDGIGVHKTPEVYGAFPTDAYSHTPMHRGAQQPGMTGQVKEDILVEMGELGINIYQGMIAFRPLLLSRDEFNHEKRNVEFSGLSNQTAVTEIPSNSLAFTYCQVPVIYRISDSDQIHVYLADGSMKSLDGCSLDFELSHEIFNRTGKINKIEVELREEHLR
jgi:hypothetical protein